MTGLNWERFERLPGDSRANFELLWRGAIWLNYSRFGIFRARAQQPGVEFHLKLERDCSLGDAGQWFGWQTKWWEIGSGTQIGATRRRDVEDSQAKTKTHLPDLTNWVLCTRRPLTPTDQAWYDGLTPGFSLDNWVTDELANLLVGEAALLRDTYFGDLVLEPHRLGELRQAAVEEVRERWFPEVHQSTDAEQALRRMLAEPEAWAHLDTVGTEISELIEAIDREVAARPLPAGIQTELDALLVTATTIRDLLAAAHEHLALGGEHSWLELGQVDVPLSPLKTPPVLRRLRAANHPASLPCTNLVARTRRAAAVAREVFDQLQIQLAVVTGEAGYGKTQLAAKLTAATESRPAGVLLYGRRLGARDELDKLAKQVTRSGQPVETFEALLAAVDAAAARARCRLPVVIDALNEAESPRAWEPLLRKLQITLKKYPSVLVVCTIREAFVPGAIPPTVTDLIELNGFTEDLDEVAQKYFDFFNIDASGADLPRELLRQPLALRIFCSVANPSRENRVGLALLPRSLNEMFDEYLHDVTQRIDQLHTNISSEDVTRALKRLGVEMWEALSRDVNEIRVRELFSDNERWEDSILAALVHEGILIRQPAEEGYVHDSTAHSRVSSAGEMKVAIVYDLLAGHIIASAMVSTGGIGFAHALRTPEMTLRFASDGEKLHPLAVDIFDALTFVLPKAGLGQLWQMVEDPLMDAALERTTELSASAVDAATIEAFTNNFVSLAGRHGFWFRMQSVRAVVSHPLNADYLDSLLRPMAVGERDLLWSEWLRSNAEVMLGDVHALTARWQQRAGRTEADGLRARWLMWMLTSTVRDLRDAATAALYWYGRGDASGVFALALNALTVNDAYIAERMVAAAYGVATAYQNFEPEFGDDLKIYLHRLVPIVTGQQSTAPTYHRLTRYYLASTVAFARAHYPGAVPAALADGIEFANAVLPAPLHDGDVRREEVDATIHMDFGNYTFGRLFEDRNNYDYEHTGHAEVTDHVLGVIYDLGWRKEQFSAIDSSIGSRRNYRDKGRTDRYGKKYGWIGFHLASGMLGARGEHVPWLEVDIDPTFPQPSPVLPIQIPKWAKPTPYDDRNWMLDGIVEVPDELLYCETLDGSAGPWVLVHAELNAKDAETGRSVFGLFNTVALQHDVLDALLAWWSAVDHPGRDIIELPTAYYLFAGEIPWHSRMVTSGDDIAGTGPPPHTGNPGGDREGNESDPHEFEDPYIDSVRFYDTDEAGKNEPTDDIAEVDESQASVDESLYTPANEWPLYRRIEYESLAHSFAWEAHHSSENQQFAYVPSQRLSQWSGLRAASASFDQVDADGRPAAKSYSAPAGFQGHLLYIREDILRVFAQGRAVITFGWGERQPQISLEGDIPGRIRAVYQSRKNIWRTHRIVAD
ncbi:hypothetical protein [Nocardia sp. BMG51109]|uniref:hypothetical protein n=1 Tax=Nocardia sp. BMG51109 TaxID=1056816 RepID=UPI000467A206|nr:hypothetical protein [Nocardia sp. BMG51109]